MPPSQVSGSVPPELDGLVMRSLAKEPDDRFQTAEEMRGLVQYGLQMLYDQGGHTGTWNTGPVTMHEGLHTPAGGFAGTTALPHPHDSGTSQIPAPILPSYGGGDDGGFEGHGNKGSGSGKLWILAVLAVIAIAAGVALALHNTGNSGGGGTSTTQSPTTSKTTDDNQSSETPSDEATDQSTDTSTDDSTSTSGTGEYTPSYTPSPTTPEPTDDPTDEPTDTTPTTPEPTDDPTTPTADPTTADPTDPGTGGTVAGGGEGPDRGRPRLIRRGQAVDHV